MNNRAILKLRSINKTAITKSTVKEVDFARFIFQLSSIMQEVPHGSVLFDKLDPRSGVFDYTLQFGNVRQFEAVDFYGKKGFRLLIQQSQFGNAAAKGFGITINQGLRVSLCCVGSTFELTMSIRACPDLPLIRLNRH
jgi:hypothetical protein